MTTEAVVTQQPTGHQPSDLSSGKRQQFYRESLNLFNQGVQLGWRSYLYKAIALFNIHSNELYVVDGKSWKEFVDGLGISRRSVERYLRIAQRVREMINAAGLSPLLPRYITQKDFNTAFEPFFTNGRQANLRGLIDASRDLQSFQAYLAGEDVEDKQMLRLLSQKNTKSAAQREREERAAKIAADIHADGDAYYRSEAASHGYVWDDDQGGYRNQDGSELTEKQQAEFITAVEALKVFTVSVKAISAASSEIERAVCLYVGAFLSYRQNALDNTFQSKATELLHTALRLLGAMEDNLRGIHAA